MNTTDSPRLHGKQLMLAAAFWGALFAAVVLTLIAFLVSPALKWIPATGAGIALAVLYHAREEYLQDRLGPQP